MQLLNIVATSELEANNIAKIFVKTFAIGFISIHCLVKLLFNMGFEVMKTLLVEGWRHLAQSFAMLNQWQCLELKKRNQINLLYRDLPYYKKHWTSQANLFGARKDKILESIETYKAGDHYDAIYRSSFPYDFSPSSTVPTYVFVTSEYLFENGKGIKTSSELCGKAPDDNVRIIAPSKWSKAGLVSSGVLPEKISIVPLGFDPETFYPVSDSVRSGIRKKFGWNDDFIFLHIGAMSGNKGLEPLFKAFVKVAQMDPRIKLVLKGLSQLYNSKKMIADCCGILTPDEMKLLAERVIYVGSMVSNKELAQMYQCADVYVSSYFAEGFNIPVLEAAACGVPVICTAGGPTDDFTHESFALHIDSELQHAAIGDEQRLYLMPSLEHLKELMEKSYTDIEWRKKAGEAAAEFAKKSHTWKQVSKRLQNTIFPEI